MNEVERPRRVEFPAKIRVRVESREQFVETQAANISAGGMFIQAPAPPSVGSRVLIEFLLPDDSVLCRVAAEVARSRPGEANDPHAGMGVRFTQLDPKAKKVVQDLAPEAQEDEPARRVEMLDDGNRTSEPIIGIDLGTTNSCVAIVEDGKSRVLQFSGYDTVPSIVFVPEKGPVSVGHQALEQAFLQPTRTIVGCKRFMGRAFASRDVKTYGAFFHYPIAPDARGYAGVRVNDRVYPFEWICSRLLVQLRAIAKKSTGKDIRKCVITVPAAYTEAQRQSVIEAARLGGLSVVRLLTEPVAAAVAYGYGRELKKRVLVYDLGGGTFDATIVEVDNERMEVIATEGDPFLGGADFDDRVTEYLLTIFQREHGVSIREDRLAVQRVRFAAELAKKQLSEIEVASVDVPALTRKNGELVGLRASISLSLFESLTEDLVQRTLGIVERALTSAKTTSAQIDDVLLVGGQSRSANVIRSLTERFRKKPSRRVHPDHAVAIGASIVAAAGAAIQSPKEITSRIAPVARAPEAKRQLQLHERLAASIHVVMADGQTVRILERGTLLPADGAVAIPAPAAGEQSFGAMLVRGENADQYELVGKLQMRLTQTDREALSRLIIVLDAQGLLTVHVQDKAGEEMQQLAWSLNGVSRVEAPPGTESDL